MLRTRAWHSRIDLVHEDELLGTGGTVLANREWFAGEAVPRGSCRQSDRFRRPAFIAAHRNRPAGHVMTMLGFRTDDPSSCGILELDERDSVIAFHEKVENPPGNLANGAVYIFEPEVIDDIARLGKAGGRSLDRNYPELFGPNFMRGNQRLSPGHRQPGKLAQGAF